MRKPLPDLHNAVRAKGLPARFSRVSPSATAAAGTVLGAILVHLQAAAAEVLRIQFLDRFKTFFPVLHFDESESPRAVRELVNDDFGRIHHAIAFKETLELAFAGIEGQVADINVYTHSLTPLEKAPDTFCESAFAVTNKGSL